MITGLIHRKRPVYLDHRGLFTELYKTNLFTNELDIPILPRQTATSVSEKNVVRGLHCSRSHKMVNVVQGVIWDVAYDVRPDSPTYGQMYYAKLDAKEGDTLILPPGIAHGFCALTSNAIVVYVQGTEWGPNTDIEINPLDEKMAIPWPIAREDMIISNKDMTNPLLAIVEPKLSDWVLEIPRPYCDAVLIGSNGYVGSWFLKTLKEKKLKVCVSNERLQDRTYLETLIAYCKPRNVIVCAGIAGKPNIDWCKDHPAETIDTNVTSQLALVEICRRLKVHVTLILSGAIYKTENGEIFTEASAPNNVDHPYTKFRQLEEELLLASQAPFLGLRIHYPISSDGHPRSLLSKLLTFKSVFDCKTSLTCLDEVVPLGVEMALHGKTGIYNATNPGVIGYGDILRLYKEKHPGVTIPPIDSQGGRWGCHMDTQKIEQVAKELNMRLSQVSIAMDEVCSA